MLHYYEFQLALFNFSIPRNVRIVPVNNEFQIHFEDGLFATLTKANGSWLQVGGRELSIETVEKIGAKIDVIIF